jgi:transcriptional regulator of arginine metabolism
MNNITKVKRQQLLRKIISERGSGDQHHLLMEFKKNGVATTQATISRDLHEMGFIRVRMETGVYRYEYFEKMSNDAIWQRLKILFTNFLSGIKSTGNLILLKTSPGNANGIASLVDGLQREEILGTVAGDDTVLVIIDNARNRKKVEKEFAQLLQNAPNPAELDKSLG